MKTVSKPVAAIFCGGFLAGIFDITQAFVGFSLVGIHAISNPAAYCRRDLWNSFP
jgi:hypothetical protein